MTRGTVKCASTRARRRFLPGLLLTVPPLLLALCGPWCAGEAGRRGASFTAGGGHPLGTDFVGRDVWREILLGGRSVVLVALLATALMYLLALPIGLACALTSRRWLDDLLMRPLDVLLAVPSLLAILLASAVLEPGPVGLALLVAAVNVPDAARIVRTVAAEAAARPVVEALRMQGESRFRLAFAQVARQSLPTLAADAGVRLTGVLYLVATAAFLGVGVAPDASDWAVMVDRNRTGLFLQPWAVVVPALLIVALTMGGNLLADAALAKGEDRAEYGERAERSEGVEHSDRAEYVERAGHSDGAERSDWAERGDGVEWDDRVERNHVDPAERDDPAVRNHVDPVEWHGRAGPGAEAALADRKEPRRWKRSPK
ncbi:binding-protein-dependent transport systems inner membrane component [Streptomyces albus]|uniref:Binding-protein-dependent transport systems inner membrane component n=1 Tax=Streptomyces albus (strain ATCC 21838 / DSM 41398 / FERM P-419 / JCM 4703 / NBRC 107858) TaxID=1081613 RepID=A0A0B5ENJ8_STRA4|nr:binding-protein-dependent transport systems inner membrane component [Streptomyces albus]AOU78535.1 binding-protein-dependent transport systems inner membrane component [Streptomyces albus]